MVSDIENEVPVVVTGVERKHPAIRTLARACIALAKLRIAASAAQAAPDEDRPDSSSSTSAERGDEEADDA